MLRILFVLTALVLAACATKPAANTDEAAQILLWNDEDISKQYQNGSPADRLSLVVGVLMGRSVGCGAKVPDQFTRRYANHLAELTLRGENPAGIEKSMGKMGPASKKAMQRQLMERDVPCELVVGMIRTPWF